MDKEFKLLYEEHYAMLCRTAYRIVGDRDSSREVVQEVFVELWRRENWSEMKSIKGYLCVSVYNRAINEYQRRKKFVSGDSAPIQVTSEHSEMERVELEGILAEAINTLPEQCKKIFLLSREEELTYKEIANYLGLSVKTIERQMGIALKKLKEYLQLHWSG